MNLAIGGIGRDNLARALPADTRVRARSRRVELKALGLSIRPIGRIQPEGMARQQRVGPRATRDARMSRPVVDSRHGQRNYRLDTAAAGN